MKQTELRALMKETYAEVLDEREAREERNRPVWFWRIVLFGLIVLVLMYILDWVYRTIPMPLSQGWMANFYAVVQRFGELVKVRDQADPRVLSEMYGCFAGVFGITFFLFLFPPMSLWKLVARETAANASRTAGVLASGFSLYSLLVGQLENVFAVAGRLLSAFWTIITG